MNCYSVCPTGLDWFQRIPLISNGWMLFNILGVFVLGLVIGIFLRKNTKDLKEEGEE